MLLTQDGLRALADFTISAAPAYDENFNRVEGNDGITLTCHHGNEHFWQKPWPGHVAAPTLRDLAVVAQQHWDAEHCEPQPERLKAEAPK